MTDAGGKLAVHGGTSLYIHVPFCSAKCAYCDFASTAIDPASAATQALFDEYLEAVRRELASCARDRLLGEVPTVYVGGGTPSVLGARLPRLIADVFEVASLTPDAEVTCEANPESLDGELLESLLAAGVNRVSLGVQSLDDEVLEWLGRRHDSRTALRAARLLSESGVRFSIDLMCGIPVQLDGSWEWTVDDAIATGAGHLSVYPLTVESATPLVDRIDAGESPDTDPDAAAQQMQYAAAALRAAGFERYETASYARPGQECRHNVRYWTGGAYLGVGPGAASMLPAPVIHSCVAYRLGELPPDTARVRFTASPDLRAFLAGSAADESLEVDALSAQEQPREDAMLGLRLSRGITDNLARAAGVTDDLRSLAEQGLVEFVQEPDGSQARWRTTERGWLMGNEVFGRVWVGE